MKWTVTAGLALGLAVSGLHARAGADAGVQQASAETRALAKEMPSVKGSDLHRPPPRAGRRRRSRAPVGRAEPLALSRGEHVGSFRTDTDSSLPRRFRHRWDSVWSGGAPLRP